MMSYCCGRHTNDVVYMPMTGPRHTQQRDTLEPSEVNMMSQTLSVHAVEPRGYFDSACRYDLLCMIKDMVEIRNACN